MKKRTISLLMVVVIFAVCFTLPFQANAAVQMRVLYQCDAPYFHSQWIRPSFIVYNDGPDTLDLSKVKIRYWYTNDIIIASQQSSCLEAAVGASNVTRTLSAMNYPTETADTYLEVGFTPGAGSMKSGANSDEIKLEVTGGDYWQTGDYSYNSSLTTYGENPKVAAYYDGALVYGIEPSFGPKQNFLVIVSKPLYDTGLITSALNTYLADLAATAWTPLMITIDNTASSSPDYVCLSPSDLKAVIRSYYNQQYCGFVLIGSAPAIPTAYWRYNQNPDESISPTDLFYADMDPWMDSNYDGVYESYDANNYFYGANFAPEMIWGRISAGCISSSINEEALKVAFYLNKVHLCRTTPIATMQNNPTKHGAALVFNDGDYYKGGRNVIETIQGLSGRITGLFDDSLTTRDRLKTELERGYQFVQYAIPSTPDCHLISEWSGNTRTYSNFDLAFLETVNPRVEYINMFSAGACRFSDYPGTKVANIGATYIFNKDYVVNVSGSTGPWGFMPDTAYWDDIGQDKPIGEAFRNYFQRMVNINHEDGAPKGVLLGDPTLVYLVPRYPGKTAYISSNLAGEPGQPRVITGDDQDNLVFQATDPQNGPVEIRVVGLPGGDIRGTNSIYWYPPNEALPGTTYQATVTASGGGGDYTEEFSVRVIGIVGDTLTQNWDFETVPLQWSTSSWNSNCIMQLDNTAPWNSTYTAKIYSSVPNDCCFYQTVTLTPNTYYQLSGTVLTEGVSGGLGAAVSVEFDGELPLSSKAITGDHNWNRLTLDFYSGDHTSAKVQCRLGMSGAYSSGTAWFDYITLYKFLY